MPKTVAIICRGHSASRAISEFFIKNGFYFGEDLNASYDKQPYDVLDQLSRYVLQNCYSFKDHKFKIKLIKPTHLEHAHNELNKFLSDIHNSPEPLKGWKETDTIFVYPLLTQIFPDYYYLFWTRSISRKNEHERGDSSDNLLYSLKMITKNKPYNQSWNIQNQIVLNSPKPKHFLHMRMEDFILDQDTQVHKLEKWLDMPLPERIEVNKKVVHADDHYNLDSGFLKDTMRRLGYIK